MGRSSDLSRIADEVFWQKYKYWLKTLSQQAIDSNLLTYADMFDYIRFLGDTYISDTVFSSLLASVLLGIPLSDVVPLSLVWRIELPSIDDFLKGKLLEFVKDDITKVFPELLSIHFTVFSTLQPDYARNLVGLPIEKGVFGKSRYGQSVYDPVASSLFFRSTLFSFMKRDVTDYRKIAEVKNAAVALGVADDMARYVFNALQVVSYAKDAACSLDYCWFDSSTFPAEGSEARVSIVDYDGNTVDVEYLSLVDASGGCWLDNCLMDYSFFMPDEAPTVYIPEREGNLLTEVARYISSSFASRITASSLALGNYQRVEERTEFRGTGRVDSYAMPRAVVENTRSTVLRIVEKYERRAFVQNLYVSAALNLLKTMTKPYGWGDEAPRAMTREELMEYWIGKWESRGLDRRVLEEVFKVLYDTNYIRFLAERRYREKESVSVSRGGI